MCGKGSGKSESFIAETCNIAAILNYLQRRMFNVDTQ